MTRNPYLKRLLGEGAQQDAQTELAAPRQTLPGTDDEPPSPDDQAPPEAAPVASAPQGGGGLSVQQLAQQWQQGEHMGVATSLMFTDASYKDFVDLVYIIGREAGQELGALLDELAETAGEQAPETPPQYSDLLKRVSGNEEAGVI